LEKDPARRTGTIACFRQVQGITQRSGPFAPTRNSYANLCCRQRQAVTPQCLWQFGGGYHCRQMRKRSPGPECPGFKRFNLPEADPARKRVKHRQGLCGLGTRISHAGTLLRCGALYQNIAHLAPLHRERHDVQ
jgi:hypothetical protein